jgi:uncharacterized protein HemX
MSDKNPEDTMPAETGDASFGDEPDEPRVSRAGAGVAWLALIVALAALLAAGWSGYSAWRSERQSERRPDPLLDVQSRVATSEEAVERIDAAMNDLESADTAIEARLDRLRKDLDARLERIDSLPPRLANLENSLSALQGISAGARNTWLIAEAEYYLQIANAQLQLANNPRLAALALGMADERVAAVGDPALTDVRRALADELTALDGMQTADVVGVTLTLASLARVVDDLPLRTLIGRAGTDEPVAAEGSGLDRAWSAVRNAMGSLVKHSKPGDTAIPLMTPDAEVFLRTNLKLQLQTARLALLRGEQAAFTQSLDDAARWLREYFDPAKTPVRSALETITEIRDAAAPGEKPDISESLRLLRQYRTLTETAQ